MIRMVFVIGVAIALVWMQGGPGAAIYVVTLLCLAAMSVLARNHPWPGLARRRTPPPPAARLHLWAIPGCPRCAECTETNPPPCDEHGARELARMPRYHPERVVHGTPNPEGFAALEKLLGDEGSLAEASAAEQDARLSAEPDNEGIDR